MLGIWTEQYGGRLVFTAQMLPAAVATWLLTWAETYPSSWSPRSASASPAGRSRSAWPMSRAGIPTEQQGTALGIFGAGNVGAAVTKFVAPFVHGRLRLAGGGAGLGDRARGHGGRRSGLRQGRSGQLASAGASGAKPSRAWLEQLAPLKKLQVWRFSLYYFFVFGAFVALALWLPHYLDRASTASTSRPPAWRRGVLAAGQPVPRLWRASLRPVRRAAR